MTKNDAIQLLGGTTTSAANMIGITAAAVSQWPEVLPLRLIDRVQAALARKMAPHILKSNAELSTKDAA